MEANKKIFELVDAQFKEQREFAAAVGVSASMVSAWRSGTSKSYMSRIAQIARVLGTTVGYLLGEEDEPPVQEDWISATEIQLISAYRLADDRTRQMVDLALRPWKKSAQEGQAM